MKAIILAAGKGARLNGTIGDKPKCLLRIGGRTLVERQIDSLRSIGVDDIVVVVGCEAACVRDVCGPDVSYIENTRFAQTNSLYSLWMARHLLQDGVVIMNCDVLFHPQMLADLVSARRDDSLLVAYQEDDDRPMGDEEMKVRVRRGRVAEISKTMSPDDADGENVGIVKFGPAGGYLLSQLLERRVAAGGLKEWAPHAFNDFAQLRSLHVVGTRGYPWTEIDFPEDYERAVREVLPAIEGEPLPFGAAHRSSTTVIEQPDATIVVRAVRMRPDADTMPLSPASGE
jgi:choline kinase